MSFSKKIILCYANIVYHTLVESDLSLSLKMNLKVCGFV